MKDKIKFSFKDKSFRYGSFSTIMTIIVIAILVLINFVSSQIGTKFDLTEEKLYSLSEESIEVLQNIDNEVTIYPLFATGAEDVLFTEILEQYPKISNKIKLEYKDPNISPTFVEKYQTDGNPIRLNSIIVESENRYKIIDPSELVGYEFNQQTYQQEMTTVDIEPKVTNAIQYVLLDTIQTAYQIQGHNEYMLTENYITYLNDSGITYNTLDLKTTAEIPDDASVLIITTPGMDYSKDEISKITDYMDNRGGNLLILTDNRISEAKNLKSFVESYGVTVSGTYVFEGDTARIISPADPKGFFSIPGNHSSLDAFKALDPNFPGPFIYNSTAIEELNEKRSSVTITPIASTTDKAYGKSNPDSETVEKESGDINGPFNVAVGIEDTNNGNSSNIILMSTLVLLDEQIDMQVMGGMNSYYFVEFVKSLSGELETTFIPPKSLTDSNVLVLNSNEQIIIGISSLVVIPSIILILGITRLRRRRSN